MRRTQYTSSPLRQSTPTTLSVYSERPPPYRSQSAVTLQSDHSLGPTRPPIPQSTPRFYSISNSSTRPPIPESALRFHSIPNTPTRPPIPELGPRFHSIPNTPTSRPQTQQSVQSTPPWSNGLLGTVPSRQPILTTPYASHGTIAQAVNPQAPRNIYAFVASDPFRVFRGDDEIDVPSDGLTFDDIPTAESAPGNLHGASQSQTFGGSLPNIAPPPGPIVTQLKLNNSRPSMAPEVLINRIPDIVPSVPNYQAEYCEVPPLIMPVSSMGDIPTAESAPGNLHGASPSQMFGGSLPNIAPFPAETYAQGPIATQSKLNNSRPSMAPEVLINRIPDIVPSIPNYQARYCEVPPVIMPVSSMGLSAAEQSQSQVFPDLPMPPRLATERPSIVQHRPSFPSLPEDITFSHFQEESIFTRFTRFFRFGRSQRVHSPAPNSSQPSTVIYHDSEIGWRESVLKIVLVTVPGQLYLLFLLRLPSLYFSRVARIFEEAEMSLPEIKKMALETASQGLTHELFEMQIAFGSPSIPPAYKRLTSTWKFFIDSVMREWKTSNIISVLLLSAILTIFQIQGVADDPLTRYTALFSLMCALISLLFGCMYIIRFGSMRKSYKAAEWALEAQKTRMLIWWNVWVLLAMPAIWLTWSIILYIACIMSFVWRTGVTDTTPHGLSDTGLLAIRIALTVVLGIGLLYGFLILRTFRRYGVVMDKAWRKRLDEWIQGKARETPAPSIQPVVDNPQLRQYPSMHYGHPPVRTSYSRDTYSRMTSDQYEYFPSRETMRDDRSYIPPPETFLVVPPRRPLPPTPTPITFFTEQSSEAKDYAEEIQSLRITPKKPSLGVSPPGPPRPLPPIPETPTTPFIDPSSEDNYNALGLSIETGNGVNGDDDTPEPSTEYFSAENTQRLAWCFYDEARSSFD